MESRLLHLRGDELNEQLSLSIAGIIFQGEDLSDDTETAFAKLHEKQESVRTTFNLSPEALGIKEELADEWDITQKSVLDCLLVFAHNASEAELKEVYRLGQEASDERGERKTHVLTAWALDGLEELSERAGLHRDVVLEGLLRYAQSQVEEFAREQRKKHEEALPHVRRLLEDTEELRSKLDLSSHDPLRSRLLACSLVIENLLSDLEEEIANGTPIDPN